MSDANGDDDPPNTSMEEPPNDSEQASKADGQAQEVPANLSDPSPTCKFSRPPRPREDSGRSNRGGWRNGGSWKAGRARQHRNEWGESAHRQHWDTGMNNYNGGDQGSIPRRMTRGKCYQDGMFGNGGSRSGYGDSWDNMVGVGGGPAAYDQSQRHHPYSGPAQLGGLDFSNSRTSHDQNQHPFRRGRGGYAKSHQFEGFRRGSHFSNGSGQHMGNQNIASYGGSPSGFNQNHIPNFQTGPHASLQSPPFSTNPLFAFPGQNSYSTASPQFPNQSSMLGSAINQPFPIDFTGGAIFAGQQLSQQSQLQQSVPFSAAMAFPVLSLQSPVQGPILQSNFLGQQNVQPQLQQQQLQTLHNHQQQQQILLYNAYSCMGLHIASSSSPQPPQLQPSPVVAPLPASPGPSPLPKTPLGAKPTAKKGAFPKSVSAELRPQPQPSKPARKYEIKPRMPGASVFGNNFSIGRNKNSQIAPALPIGPPAKPNPVVSEASVSEESSSMPVVNSFSSVDSFVDSKPNAEQEVYPGSACEDIDQVEALDSSTAPSLSESKETADMDDDSSDFDCRLHSEREQSMDLDCRRSAADSKSFHSINGEVDFATPITASPTQPLISRAFDLEPKIQACHQDPKPEMVEEISISVDDAAAFSSPEEGELEEIEGESVSRRRRSRHLAVDCTLHVSQTDDARNCGSQCNVTNINEALSMHEGAWHYSSEAVKISIQAGPKSEQCLSPKMSADPSPECSATTRLLRNAEGGSGCELLSIVKHSEVDDPLPEISAPTDSHLPSPHETVTPCSAEGVSLLVSDRKDVDVIIDRASKLYTVSMIARGTGTQSCDETDERVANGDYEDSTDLATNAQDCFSDCKGLNVNADERNDGGSSIIVNTGCGEIPTAAIKHEDETEEMAHLEAAGALSIEHASLCSRERERAISVVTGGDNGGTVDTSLNALKFSTHRTSNETQLEEPQIIAHSTAEDDLDASKSLLNEPVSVLAPASPEPPATIATILTTEGSPIVPAIVYRAATVLESPKDPVALAHSPQDEMQKYSSSSSTAPPVGTVDDFSELMADDLELEKDFDVVGLIDAFFT